MADRYTHGHHESVLRSHRWRTAENSAAYLLDRLRPGLQLLDVGCGPGTISVDLARIVAPGRVTAIDNAPAVVEAARAAACEQGVDNVSFAAGDTYALDYPDAMFDVVHAHQVLQHLRDPVAALREMRRVAKPGGVVAARDSDYAAMTWYPLDPLLTDWLDLYHAVARSNAGEPDAGRRLYGWARAAGFDDVHASASAWCFAAPEDRTWWGELWAVRVTESAFATRALELGLATAEQLAAIAAAWRRWMVAEDAWFAVLHAEILCTVGPPATVG